MKENKMPKKTSFATDEFPQDDGLIGGQKSEVGSQKSDNQIIRKQSSKKDKNVFSAFVMKPGIRFETQAPDEELILLLRKHIVTNVMWVLTAIIMLCAPFILFPYFSWAGLIPELPARFALLGTIMWYLLTFIIAFENFISWYFNVYLITSERVIDVDFFNLLNKRVSEARLDKIQDVTYTQLGMAQSVFNYGTVYIQTAGTEENLEFESVPNPSKVVETISELLHK